MFEVTYNQMITISVTVTGRANTSEFDKLSKGTVNHTGLWYQVFRNLQIKRQQMIGVVD